MPVLTDSFSDKSFPSREDAEAFVAGKNPKPIAHEDKFYAVAVGSPPGIYLSWDEASLAIKGVKGPKYKKFLSRAEAENFIKEKGSVKTVKEVLGEEKPEKPEPIMTGAVDVADVADKTPTHEAGTTADGSVIVYTDGSSLSNGRAGAAAGVGVWFGDGDSR